MAKTRNTWEKIGKKQGETPRRDASPRSVRFNVLLVVLSQHRIEEAQSMITETRDSTITIERDAASYRLVDVTSEPDKHSPYPELHRDLNTALRQLAFDDFDNEAVLAIVGPGASSVAIDADKLSNRRWSVWTAEGGVCCFVGHFTQKEAAVQAREIEHGGGCPVVASPMLARYN